MILSQGEILGHAKLAALLHEAEVNSTTAFDLLLDIRRAAIKARPGTAIVLEQPPRVGEKTSPGLPQPVDVLDQDNIYVVENNDIAGVLSLYGPLRRSSQQPALGRQQSSNCFPIGCKTVSIDSATDSWAHCSCAATNSSV